MENKYLSYTGLEELWSIIKDNFQRKLISGENIKTINNQSILGSGNIEIQGETGNAYWGGITGEIESQSDLISKIEESTTYITSEELAEILV